MPQPDQSVPENMGLYREPWLVARYHSWLENSWQDFVPALGALALFWLGPAPLAAVPFDSRHTLYQVSIVASVTLLGFTITSVSVLVNLIRTPVSAVDKILRAEGKARLGGTFLDCFWGVGALLCAAVIGFVHDGASDADYTTRWVEALYLAAVVLAALRFIRIAGILRLLISVG